MNLRIGICDDELSWREKVSDILKTYGKQQEQELTVTGFCDGQSLLTYDKDALHILFINVEVGGESGIDLACRINVEWPECQIVYLTENLDRATDVYRSQHLYFVLKDQFEDRLPEIMDKARRQLRLEQSRIIVIVQGKEKIFLEPKEILYFEREKRITRIVTTRGEFVTNEKISSLIERLPDIDFVRCHNSYIVYLPAVQKYMKKLFLMKDGRQIMISRGYGERTRKAFERWEKIRH